MIFHFRKSSLKHPDPCRPDRAYRMRPLLPVLLIGSERRILSQLLLDTGSAGIVLPLATAEELGIRNFRSTGMLQGVGVGPSGAQVARYAEVLLRIHQGGEACQWKSIVAFTEATLPVEGIFGISGGLEYFHTTIDVFANQITLIFAATRTGPTSTVRKNPASTKLTTAELAATNPTIG